MLCSAPFPSDVLLMLLLGECIVLVYEAWLVWVMEVVLCPFNITIVSLHALVQWSASPPPSPPFLPLTFPMFLLSFWECTRPAAVAAAPVAKQYPALHLPLSWLLSSL